MWRTSWSTTWVAQFECVSLLPLPFISTLKVMSKSIKPLFKIALHPESHFLPSLHLDLRPGKCASDVGQRQADDLVSVWTLTPRAMLSNVGTSQDMLKSTFIAFGSQTWEMCFWHGTKASWWFMYWFHLCCFSLDSDSKSYVLQCWHLLRYVEKVDSWRLENTGM